GVPPPTQHSRTVGAHSGQRPTSQTYAHTSAMPLAIVTRLSVLTAIARTLCSGCVRSPRRYILTETPASALPTARAPGKTSPPKLCGYGHREPLPRGRG